MHEETRRSTHLVTQPTGSWLTVACKGLAKKLGSRYPTAQSMPAQTRSGLKIHRFQSPKSDNLQILLQSNLRSSEVGDRWKLGMCSDVLWSSQETRCPCFWAVTKRLLLPSRAEAGVCIGQVSSIGFGLFCNRDGWW